MKQLTLNNDVKIPIFGFGNTFSSEMPNVARNPMYSAVSWVFFFRIIVPCFVCVPFCLMLAFNSRFF